jgi:murein DD-endopeptidase MepM/ murein hydrolase activator NlpD
VRKLLLCFLLLWLLPATASAGLQLEGELRQGGLVFGQLTGGDQLYLNSNRVPLLDDGRFILGFGRDAPEQQRLTWISSTGSERSRTLQIQPRTYQIQRINGISTRMLNPAPEDLKRIGKEAQLVAQARKQSSTLEHPFTRFRWPLSGPITGVYGSQRVLNGEPRRPHFGIDIAAPSGTPVRAPTGGRVTLAHPGMFFSGGTLIIDHGLGLSSSFLHLNRILVNVGERVAPGQKIATVGATGRVTGPHLDWRINWFDQRLDPALLVPPMPE